MLPAPRGDSPPPANAAPVRLADLLDQTMELYASARRALTAGAVDVAAARLSQAGEWLALWEARTGGRPGEKERSEVRGRLLALRDEAAALRSLVESALRDAAVARGALEERRRTLRSFGAARRDAGAWLDERG